MAYYKYKSGKKNQKSYSHAQSQNGRKSSPSGDALEKEYDYWSNKMRHYFNMSFCDFDKAFHRWEALNKKNGLQYALHKLQERPMTFGKMRPYYICGIWKSPYYYLRPKGIQEASRIAGKWHSALSNLEEHDHEQKKSGSLDHNQNISAQEKEIFETESERAKNLSRASKNIRTSWLEDTKRKVYGHKRVKDQERER